MSNKKVEHFSISLPKSEGNKTISKLLRHLANNLDDYKDIYVRDIVLHNEVDDDGELYPYITVYFS